MKKLMKVGCSALVLATLVAGCGSKGDTKTDGDKRVLKIDAFDGGNGQQFLKDLETAFEAAHKDVDVQLRIEKELPSLLDKENATGTYSDLVYFNLGQPSAYTETQLNTGEVLDISDVFKDLNGKVDASFTNSTVSQYMGDGKNYLAPISYTPAGFYYNTELIGEGKKYALPETWDDMWALGEKAKADGISLFTYPVKGYFDTTIMGMLDQLGGQEFFGKALKYEAGTWDSEVGTKITSTIAKLVSSDNLFKDTVSNANTKDEFTKNQQAVIDGKALFMPNGSWVVGEMAKTTPETGFHWGVMALPAFEQGGNRVATSFTEQMWIPKQAKNAADAKEFLKFMYSDEGSAIMLKAGMVTPVVGAKDKIEDPLTKEFYSIYDNEKVKPSIGAYAPYDTTKVKEVFKDVVYGPIDEIAQGKSDAATWQSQLTAYWAKLKDAPVATK